MTKKQEDQHVSSLPRRQAGTPGEVGRPPVVAVLGHVDHGKTTLLDTIRKTSVAAREHGGITQHVGAYQIELKTKNKEPRAITFIDTPGHEAFDKMRSRGAAVADIALLVVAADDSVKPQTVESIQQIKSAGIPTIVALNKIDLPEANIEKVKADLAKAGVQVEGFGGDVPVAAISAKAGTGLPELLDLILLVAQMGELKSEPSAPLEAVVIETRLDKGKGMIATVIVKKGTLIGGQTLYEGSRDIAKIRALFDENGEIVREAPPGKPVVVLGFRTNPTIGALLTSVPSILLPNQQSQAQLPAEAAMPDFMKPLDEHETVKFTIVLKADTAGSREAILASLHHKLTVIGGGIGDISEADVLHAKSSRAIIIGFNVKCSAGVEKLAQTEKVVFRIYNLIYELLAELSEVAEGLKEVVAKERELGIGTIVAEFPFEKDRIAGTKVTSGRLARGDTVKVMRLDVEIGRAKVKSIRRGKDEINKVEEGNDCGVLFDKKLDFALGDAIIAVTF